MGKVFANEPLDRNERPVALKHIPRVPLLIILWSFFALTTVVIIFRIAIRIWLQRRLFWDDAFCLAGYAGQIAQMVMVTVVSPLIYIHLEGFSGKRPPPEYGVKITKMIRLVYAHNVVFTASLYCIKGSFLALYWRLIRDLSDYRKAWWAVAVFCMISLIINAALFPVGCSTLEAFHCIDRGSIYRTLVSLRFNTAMDIVTDVCIMVLPIVLIVRSNLPGPEKGGLVVLFALGFSIITISVVRIIKSNGYQSQPPLSWLLFWSTMETAVAVITCCLATFKSLFNLKQRPGQYSYYTRTRTSRRRRRTRTARGMDDMTLTLPTISDLEATGDSQPTGNNSLVDRKESSLMSVSSDRKTAKSHDAELKEEIIIGTSNEKRASSTPEPNPSDCDRQLQAPSMAQLR
ncbi:hypothetical protein MGYG_06424 [Nannizzia gypsea CBS 118893]|uniref:Rhodopsin domain-containing protein n=1 Tax=Arthroderma gypseum (strain ATCC MYA-4604 / CBS 118893) TaxID=535722 RepID=E4UZ97_ARTGP|nr:hypothetical protein MGYG_06424 [Nannizzia gypsea CBS 118893]EFR03427.1 hypothetical protein MGYG_06424 [Nannizzia gypsea CBS 118893]